MPRLLPTLLLLAALVWPSCPPALAQSPWGAAPGAPNYFNGLPAGGLYLFSPQPNVLWGKYIGAQVRGVNMMTTFCTGDNGLTWQQGPGAIDLSPLDAQNAFALNAAAGVGQMVLTHTTTGPAGFATVAGSLPPGTVAIHFFTSTIGLAMTYISVSSITTIVGPVYRTTDGGISWTLVAPAPTLPTPAGSNSGYNQKYAVGNSLWLRTSLGELLHTADAGLTWTTMPGVGEVVFEDERNGLAYSSSAFFTTQHLFRTADAGHTWSPVSFSGQPWLRTVAAVPGLAHTYISAGYLSGWDDTGKSAISRDGGTSWQVLANDNVAYTQLMATGPTQLWTATAFNYRAQRPSTMLLRYAGTALAAKNPADPAACVEGYPNPTHGTFQLTGPLQGQEVLRLYDAVGRLCQVEQVSDSRRNVDLAKQPAGLYHLTLTAPDGTARHLHISRQ